VEAYVEIVHALPARVRLRAFALRNRREECAAGARVLAALPGVADVRADPFTGSFVVHHARGRVDPLALASALSEAIGARGILSPGERPPARRAAGPAPPSAVGRALYQVFRDLNQELLQRTGGGLDLGVLATAAFVAMGAAEVVGNQKLKSPPWFNLAWWAFQTFMSAEGEPGDVSDGTAAGDPVASD
jgi:hypothetical protein